MSKSATKVVGVVLGVVVGVALAPVLGVSVLTGAALGALAGGVVGAVSGSLFGGMFDVPDYNVTQNAQAENDGILINKTGMLENIPVVYGQRKVGGKIVFLTTGSDRNKYLYMAVILAEGEIDSIGDVYIDDVISTHKKFEGRIRIDKFTGSDNQSASELLKESDKWTDNHKLQGLAYLACRFEWRKITTQDEADANPYKGLPKVQAVIKGKKVQSAATAGSVTYENETGLSWSSNPADNLLDYLRNPRYGRGLANNRIDFSSFSIARAKLAETVNYRGGGTGPVVTCDAVVNTGRTIFDNTKLFLANMRCGMPYVQGQFKLVLQDTGNATNSQNTTPSIAFAVTEDHLIGGINVSGAGIKNQFNQLKLTYIDPTNEWKTNEVIYPELNSVRDQELLAEDNNRRLVKEMAFNHIIHKNVAADLAHIILETSRKRKFIEIKTTAELHNVIVNDIISVTYAPLGFNAAYYRVREMKMNSDYTFTITAEEHTPANYVFNDNNAIYGSSSQKRYVGDLIGSKYYYWNGTEWVGTNVPPATIYQPTLPAAPIVTSTELVINSVTIKSTKTG